MKKRAFILSFILMFFCVLNVEAASTCDYKMQVQLNTEAANVKTNYEVKEIKTGNLVEADLSDEEYEEEFYTGVELRIYNLTENLYVVITNTENDNAATYHYRDTTDGTITIQRGIDGLDEIVTYKITIYSDYSDCSGEEQRKIEIKTPRYNYFSSEPQCDNSNKYYCESYITEEINMTYSEFIAQAKKDNIAQKEEEKKEEEENDFWKNYGLFIIIGLVIVAMGVGATVIVRLKQRSSVK